MDELIKLIMPALIGAVSATIGILAYIASKRRSIRSAQMQYLQTVFQYAPIPQYFSYILWNVHFLSNISRLFGSLVIEDDGLRKIDTTNNAHTHIIIEILSYIALQASDMVKIAKKRSEEPPASASYLLSTFLIRERINNPTIASSFKKLLSSGEEGDHELKKKLNAFIMGEKLRMYERTSYMSFLLPFACFPDIRQKLIQFIDDGNLSESERWVKIENELESFLQGKAGQQGSVIDQVKRFAP